MKTYTRTKLKGLSVLAAAIAVVLCVCTLFGMSGVRSANAQVGDLTQAETDGVENEATPRGLFASLSLAINGGDGMIWATVKNDFTLLPSTVVVIVELYCSDTYYESHEDMELVSINSTEDLNMGKTITAEASTGGVQKYWQGRMRYKVDKKGWQSETTGTMKYSAEGEYLGLL